MKKDIGYLDIETADWSIFVVGATLKNGVVKTVWHDADAFREWLFAAPNVEWRAHNGGRFDFIFVLEYAQRNGLEIKTTMRGASILKASVGSISFVDTCALAPVSLAKFAKCAGQTQKGEFDYSKIEPGMDRHSALGKELEDYLHRDLFALRDADLDWRRVLLEVGQVEPSLTLGGTAWKSAAKYAAHCGEDVDVPMSIENYADGRAGYYGGRVEVFRQFAPIAYTCDRNSSYPAALVNQRVPVGRRTWGRTLDKDGTIWARVKVPDTNIPPLPIRLKGKRLAFPVGEFDGCWTAIELRNAIERHGTKLLKIYRSRNAERTTDALAGWCSRVWKARESMPAWNALLKLFANSLTGKLAQQPERETLGFSNVLALPSESKLLTPPDSRGFVWFAKSKLQVSPCARPEWSAYLTAEARIELLAQLSSIGDSAVYSDTDSVFATREIARNIGTGLGQWKDEGRISEFAAYGPKFYKYDKSDGTQISKAKGMSGLTREGFDRLVSGESWELRRGVESIKSTIRRVGIAAFAARTSVKGSHRNERWVGARLAGANGRTRPATLSQLVTEFG